MDILTKRYPQTIAMDHVTQFNTAVSLWLVPRATATHVGDERTEPSYKIMDKHRVMKEFDDVW